MPVELEPDRSNCQPAVLDGRQQFPPPLSPGTPVTARDAQWRVVASVSHDDCEEIRLCGPTGNRVLLSPFDRVVPLRHDRRLRSVSARRWARSVAALIRDSRSPARLHVTSTAAAILPHQLDPALAIAGGACRLLLADEVGLGKTVQAGWIIADLVAREWDARVLVCLPAGLARQWRDELRRFFGIHAAVADAAWLRHRIASLPADVNPWCLPGIYIVSIDFIKRGDVTASLADDPWDLLVVDEAHGAAAPTERYTALAAIARNARRIVLVTATPFSGNAAAFQSLGSLGDMGTESPAMYRRSREDIGAGRRRAHRFTLVRLEASEVRLQRSLERYTAAVWRANGGGAARLAVTILRKRALSSPAAVARSLRRRAALLALAAPAPQQLTLFDEGAGAADEEPSVALGAPGLIDVERERRWLDALAALADAAGRVDSKQRALARLLTRLGSATSAIVFTEYRDTLQDLAARHPCSLHLHGGLSAAERDAVQRRFNADGGLLLATDAAAEGLNLQQRCRLVINYELPWNPARLEQRIGRVDRMGQRLTVHALSLVARDTAEDLVLANLLKRLDRVARHLGARDRLAAFLDDARLAQEAIGGEAVEPAAGPPLPVHPIATISSAAVSAAAQLETLRLLGAEDARRADGEVVVCRVRRSGILPAGVLFVIEWRALSRHGHPAAADIIPVHAASGLDPRQADVVRAVARIARHRGAALLAKAVAERTAAHDALSAREREFAARQRPVAAQPGLFDRRVPSELETPWDAEAARRGQVHQRRLALLDGAAGLQSELHVAAVLFVAEGPR